MYCELDHNRSVLYCIVLLGIYIWDIYEGQGSVFRQFREKSAWCPSVKELDPVIDIYLKHLEAKVGEIEQRGRNYSNLSSDEQDALRKLKVIGI